MALIAVLSNFDEFISAFLQRRRFATRDELEKKISMKSFKKGDLIKVYTRK